MKNDKNKADSSLYDISQRIITLRKQKKLTQERLGELVGVSASTISGYENDTNFPSLEVVVRLVKIFGVTADELLGITELPPQTNPDDIVVIKGLPEHRKKIVRMLVDDFQNSSKI